MRGEEYRRQWHTRLCMELPPHARRRASRENWPSEELGITSACAEKRGSLPPLGGVAWNYLRMRGEERCWKRRLNPRVELPPHARRRAKPSLQISPAGGITSACAEKRKPGAFSNRQMGNYLRMRGEETALPAETLAVGVVL